MEDSKQKIGSTFAEYFKEIIYGGIDGIVTTFAVVAGFAGASLTDNATMQLTFGVVLLFGLANLFADAASMGLGNFLSVRSEKDLYNVARKKELALIRKQPDTEILDTIKTLQIKGFTPEQAQTLAAVYKSNEEYWLDFKMQNEQDMSDPRGENEMFTGLATFLSFMVFGAVPLLPFMVQSNAEVDPGTVFFYSCIGTFVALVLLGLLKWRVIGSDVKSSLFEVVAVGGTAAILAYLVGTLFAI